MDRDRYEEWVKRSFRWARDPERDLGLPHHVQLLGIVDAEIRGLRQENFYGDAGRPIKDEYGILILERAQILAHLWVLGAYEYVRMIAQRLDEDRSLATDGAIAKIGETKLLFARLRVPLAKLEPAERHKDTDYSVPLPGVGTKGLGWQINESLIIYQAELSDAFLATLSAIRPRSKSL
jgi:hypothetical protein